MSDKMRVLVLGGSGYIGSRLCKRLAQSSWATPVCASSRQVAGDQVRQSGPDAAGL